MVVQHNMQALNANRMLGVTAGLQAKSTEKLASGYQINRAADDAAGLSISEKMRKQIRGLDQASTNAQDGISAVQTAEGALTEVHSMLQRMNELAVQAANGTNSESDRMSIQNEIEQLTTEIDRVAETTKFNETYMLKGNGKTATLTVSAKDAGIAGKLVGAGTGTATFTMTALKYGDSINIGGKGYTIGAKKDTIETAIGGLADKAKITINGTEYTVLKTGSDDEEDPSIISQATAKAYVNDGAKVICGTQTYVAMKSDTDGVSDNDGSIITADKAYRLIKEELRVASSIGCDPGDETSGKQPGVADAENGSSNAANITVDVYSEAAGKICTQVSFKITEGTVETKQGLQMGLHVGADADGANKITFAIDTMNSAGLGVQGLNVVDTTGAKATYAIDAIAEAIQKVSDQRSTLGAVQNRLDHTIANLDNVVENTTSAESAIRDTDMAAEMVEYTKNNILSQAGQAMLAQANTSTQGVLSLLG